MIYPPKIESTNEIVVVVSATETVVSTTAVVVVSASASGLVVSSAITVVVTSARVNSNSSKISIFQIYTVCITDNFC